MIGGMWLMRQSLIIAKLKYKDRAMHRRKQDNGSE